MTEESYTSKCSFLDWNPSGKHEVYAGNRVKRGLFRASRALPECGHERRLQHPTKSSPKRHRQWDRGCCGSPCQDYPDEWAVWQPCPCCLELYGSTGKRPHSVQCGRHECRTRASRGARVPRDPETVSHLSPYTTRNWKRFGEYAIPLTTVPPPLTTLTDLFQQRFGDTLTRLSAKPR